MLPASVLSFNSLCDEGLYDLTLYFGGELESLPQDYQRLLAVNTMEHRKDMPRLTGRVYYNNLNKS